MAHQTDLVIIGISVGVAIGLLIAACIFVGLRWYRKRSHLPRHSERSVTSLPIRMNGVNASIDTSVSLSNSIAVHSSNLPVQTTPRSWWSHHSNDLFASTSGIPRYSYKGVVHKSMKPLLSNHSKPTNRNHVLDWFVSSVNSPSDCAPHSLIRAIAMLVLTNTPDWDIQKATQNFTTILGQGSFGPVYKAIMTTSEVVAVKVLASDSKQGEKEFQTEVLLLGRLHHRSLVNLIGYCVDKGQHMLIYEYMSNGSLESLLYNEGDKHILSWDERLQVALDVSHGIEYLHEGAVPPVIHRDLKSANILLDRSMRAKVADFGLSKEEVFDGRKSGLKGTYGYMDPDYVSTSKLTIKSDVYSFGVIIFELITGIHPHQNLMEYVNLAGMSPDGVDEILDKNLVGTCNIEEVRLLAGIAHKCIRKTPRRRPSIGDVSQAISKVKRRRLTKEDSTLSFAGGDVPEVIRRIEHQQVELSNIASMKVGVQA